MGMRGRHQTWWERSSRHEHGCNPGSLTEANPYLALIFNHTPHSLHQETLFYLQNVSRISPASSSHLHSDHPDPSHQHLSFESLKTSLWASMLLSLLPSTYSQHRSWSCIHQLDHVTPLLRSSNGPSDAVSKQFLKTASRPCYDLAPVISVTSCPCCVLNM